MTSVTTYNIVNGHAALRSHVSKQAAASDQTLMRVNDAIDEVRVTASNIQEARSLGIGQQRGDTTIVNDLADRRADGEGTVSGTVVASNRRGGGELFPEWNFLDLQSDFPRASTDEGSCRIKYNRTADGEVLLFQSAHDGDMELRTHKNGTLTVLQEFLELPPLEGKRPIAYSWT